MLASSYDQCSDVVCLHRTAPNSQTSAGNDCFILSQFSPSFLTQGVAAEATRLGRFTTIRFFMAGAQHELRRSNQKKLHYQRKKSLNQSSESPGFFVSPQYPSSLSESLTEDKQSLKINASLSTVGKQSVDPHDENNQSDVTAPAYIPDPRKCVIYPCSRTGIMIEEILCM